MGCFSSPPPVWFQNIVRDVTLIVMREWAERCLPCNEKPVRGGWSNPRFTERSTPLEGEMPQETSATLPADVPFGYDVFGLKWTNNNGVEVAVDPATVTATASDPAVVPDARYVTEDGVTKGFFNPSDAAATGATSDITWSATADSTVDDIVMHYTVGADRLVGDASGVTTAERTAPLA